MSDRDLAEAIAWTYSQCGCDTELGRIMMDHLRALLGIQRLRAAQLEFPQ